MSKVSGIQQLHILHTKQAALLLVVSPVTAAAAASPQSVSIIAVSSQLLGMP